MDISNSLEQHVLAITTIDIKDVSNMGFRLVLDDVRLISFASVSAADSPLLPLSNMVPVLADDLDELKSGNNRYLLKLEGGRPLPQCRLMTPCCWPFSNV
jgi:hypothetical protein